MSITVVILAGGKGERLRPFTYLIPKPLMPVKDTPILEILIKDLKKNNFKNIVLATNYKEQIIKSFLRENDNFGINIKLSSEKKFLGTVGPLKKIKNLSNNFLVINGDTLSNLNYYSLIKNHIKSKKLLSVATTMRKIKSEYGILELKNSILTKFLEKPVNKYYVSLGIYVMNKKILKEIPKNKKFGIDDLIKKMLKKRIAINIFKHYGKWIDIGNISEYYKAQKF